MASADAYRRLLAKGYPVDHNPYNRYDALESNSDLEVLFEALASVTDKQGNPALMTLNNVVANPDFAKIRESGFREYSYETFERTLERYPVHNRVMSLYREGVEKRMLKPQFHGREHLNLFRWMRDLRAGDQALLDAFDEGMFSLHSADNPAYYNEYLDALDIEHADQFPAQARMLREGYSLFADLWGYSSESFIANCYVWHPEHEKVLNELGVKFLQGIPNQFVPLAEPGYRYNRKYHYMGQKNRFAQRYLIRNAFFEPYQKPGYDWVNDCLGRVDLAFRWNKPAIISAHRVNFIGFLDSSFRDVNISLFKQLLKGITGRWPEAEFISSDQLGNLMNGEQAEQRVL